MGPARKATILTPTQLLTLQRLVDQGKFQQVSQSAERIGPPETWAGADAGCLAARIIAELGASRRAEWMHQRIYAKAPAHPEAYYHHVRRILRHRGPKAAWEKLKEKQELREGSPELESDLLTLRSHILAGFRDFESAHQWLDKAAARCPGRPIVAVARAQIMEHQDRYDEAVKTAHETLSGDTWTIAGALTASHLLSLLERKDEAVEVLESAMKRFESGRIAAALAALRLESGNATASLAALEQFEKLSPMLDAAGQRWLSAQRADACYATGKIEQVIPLARATGSSFYSEFAARMESVKGPDELRSRRQRLAVGFVRQHHMTCAPATIATLTRFWKRPAEHLSIAEEICYDGTASHSQRRWAETHGWQVREFTVDRASAKALIDRGVPFAVATQETQMGHLQAIIGYDFLRDTFLVRDPYFQEVQEFPIEPFLERYRASGPRAMALAPADSPQSLAGLELPEAASYDRLHRLHLALERHDRNEARAEFEALRREAPGHRLALLAERAVAGYENNPSLMLEVCDKLLKQFPSDGSLLLNRLYCLRQFSRREERLAWLADVVGRRGCDPVIAVEYAVELCEDARQRERVEPWLQRTSRGSKVDPRLLRGSARLFWERQDGQAAFEYYRFAACSQDKDESAAWAFFLAACRMGRSDEALRMLESRCQALGQSAAGPSGTLFNAYIYLHERARAFAVLDRMLAQHPDDGEALLGAASAYLGCGDLPKAQGCLEKAKGRSAEASWNRCSAQIASLLNEPARAMEHWVRILEIEPIAVDAHQAKAELLRRLRGPAEARQYLSQLCARYPNHFGFHMLWAGELADADPAELEAALRKLMDINPANLTCRTRLARCLLGQRRLDEALAVTERACELDPHDSEARTIRGRVLKRLGRGAEAVGELREAIRLDAINLEAIEDLLELSPSPLDRQSAVALVTHSVGSQLFGGDRLFGFRAGLRRLFDPEEVLTLCNDLHARHPGLWQSWSAFIDQLLELRQTERAKGALKEAAGRFSMVPEFHMAAARANSMLDLQDEQTKSLETALKLDPACAEAALRIAFRSEYGNQLLDARRSLDAALARAPYDVRIRRQLARVLWKSTEFKEAVEQLRAAAPFGVDDDDLWRNLRLIGAKPDQPRIDVEVARELTTRTAGDPSCWLRLARVLDQPDDEKERLTAIEKSLQLDPRFVPAHQFKVEVLLGLKRQKDALAAARPAIFGRNLPPELESVSLNVEASLGGLDRAIPGLRLLLAEHPGFAGGWYRLSQWLMMIGDTDGARDAARRLLRLDPLAAFPEYVLGTIEQALDHKDAAKEHFRNAMGYDPMDEPSACALLDMLVAENNMAAARELLGFLLAHNPTPAVVACGVRVNLVQNEFDTAVAMTADLAAMPGAGGDSLGRVCWDMTQVLGPKVVDEILGKIIKQPAYNPHAAPEWVRARARQGKFVGPAVLNRFLERGAAGNLAILEYIGLLARAGAECRGFKGMFRLWKYRSHLGQIISRHGDWLARSEYGWGLVGYAYTRLRQPEKAIPWFAGWKTNPASSPGVLLSYVISLKLAGRDAEVAEVCRHSLDWSTPDSAKPFMRLWLAFEEALAGNLEPAEKQLAQIHFAGFDPGHQIAFLLARGLVDAGNAPAAEKKEALVRELESILTFVNDHRAFLADPPIHSAHRRTLAEFDRQIKALKGK